MADDILDAAKEWLAENGGRLQTHSDRCHYWHLPCLMARLVARVEKTTTAPPCVETDGLSSGSSGGQINRSAERQSPDRECEESQRRDYTHPDTKGRAQGGPARHTQTIAKSASKCQADIVSRLCSWVHAVDAVSASDLMDEAAGEIERLREAIRRLADQDATLSVCDGAVTVTMDATLTDEERSAVAWCVEMAVTSAADCEDEVAALRGLLERTK